MCVSFQVLASTDTGDGCECGYELPDGYARSTGSAS